MTHRHDLTLETLDTLADWADDARDLIMTTPLLYDDEGRPASYDASQLFGLEGSYLGGCL
jgi:hypothetical protein